jgi:hypothetical protein
MTSPASSIDNHNPARQRSRRSFLSLVAAGAVGAWLGSEARHYWLAGALTRPARPIPPQAIAVPPVTVTTHSGIRIHGIQTGHVAIKTAHAILRGPEALRLLSIIQDGRWTPLLPILTWVIEHPEGLIVIDTGELAAATDIDSYMAGDPRNRWFYKRNLALFITPAEELASQMRALNLDPGEVRTVVMTHLHGDHAGGLPECNIPREPRRVRGSAAPACRRRGEPVAGGMVAGASRFHRLCGRRLPCQCANHARR